MLKFVGLLFVSLIWNLKIETNFNNDKTQLNIYLKSNPDSNVLRQQNISYLNN